MRTTTHLSTKLRWQRACSIAFDAVQTVVRAVHVKSGGQSNIAVSELQRYRRFWDGSESGWKVCQYKRSVWLVEFTFDESGPTDSEFDTLVEFYPPRANESLQQMREKFRDCSGWATGRPLSETQLQRIVRTGLRTSLTEVRPDHHLILMPDDVHYFIQDPSLREEVAEKMIAAGTDIETR